MREIKFRAWDKDKKVMLYNGFMLIPTSPDWGASPIESPNEEQQCLINRIMEQTPIPSDYTLIDWSNYYGFENFIVMQYTGLKDKNGKEIYEGDICKYWMDNVWKFGYVCYLMGGFAIQMFQIGDKIVNFPFYFQSFIPTPHKDNTMRDQFEIIGNIYENPELIEDKNAS